jgi:hypothetical protein
MNGNFNHVLNLKGNNEVDARGWLIWDPDDESAEITVTVTQNGSEGTEVITCTRKHDDDDPNDTWKAPVSADNGGKFVYGSANGEAEAIVTKRRGTGDPYEYYWVATPPVQLK